MSKDPRSEKYKLYISEQNKLLIAQNEHLVNSWYQNSKKSMHTSRTEFLKIKSLGFSSNGSYREQVSCEVYLFDKDFVFLAPMYILLDFFNREIQQYSFIKITDESRILLLELATQ